jgi:MoaA/NifB/PqqE/SkfB family radical SAM enzyme
LEEVGVSSIGISLYSVEEKIHDSITRVKGSCIQTKSGIKNLLRRNIDLWVNVTVSRYNQSTLFETVAGLSAMGVKNILIISVVTKDKGIKYDQSVIEGQFRRIAGKKLPGLKITLRGFDRKFSGILIGNNVGNKKIAEEEHKFDTLVPNSNNHKKYLSRTASLTGGKK